MTDAPHLPDSDPEPPDEEGEKASGRIPGENPDDDVLPVSPSRRRTATLVGIAFMIAIFTFLIWFILTHTEQAEGGMVGSARRPWAAAAGVA
jgi:hypothetical protein